MQYLSRSGKSELVESVFRSFCNTNIFKGKHYTLSELNAEFLAGSRKKYLRFEYHGTPYLAKVSLDLDPDADWINITLCNAGFKFSPAEVKEFSRYVCPNWVPLPVRELIPRLDGIMAELKPKYAGVRAFYTFSQQRFVLAFHPSDDAPAGTPHLALTFRPGYPDTDLQHAWCSIR